MPTFRADVFVNSNVGKITTEVEAATYSGAKEQIYAKHGKVNQIVNLRQVSNRSSSSSSSSDSDGNGTVALIGFIAIAWVFFSFTPWILMGLGGAFGTWIGQIITQQTLEEYTEREDNSGQAKAVFTVLLALFLGGFGFVKGTEIKADFDKPTDSPPAKVQQAK